MAQAATASGVDAAVLERLASALAQSKPSLVLAGGTGVDALDLAHAVNAINQAAGNLGQTVKPAEAITAFEHAGTYADVRDLADRMRKGAVPLLMVRGAVIRRFPRRPRSVSRPRWRRCPSRSAS